MKNKTILSPEMIEIPTPPVIQKPKFPPIFLPIILSLIFVTSLIAAYYYGIYQNRIVTPSTPNISSTPVNENPTPIPLSGKMEWLTKPQKISNPDIFTANKNVPELESYHFSEARFYETATLPDGSKLINLYLPTDGMGTYDTLFRLIKSPEGKFSFVDQYKSQSMNQWTEAQKIFSSDVTLNSFIIRELSPSEYINFEINKEYVNFRKGYLNEKTFDKLENPLLVKSLEDGDLYVVYHVQKDSDVLSREFYLKLKDSTIFSYNLDLPFFSDNFTVYFNWADGIQVDSSFYDKVASGCGTGFFGPDIIKDGSSLLSSKVQVATDNQKPIYQIKDANSPILKKLYEGYKSVQGNNPSGTPIVSYEQYLNLKTHFLYQDFLGDWLIFVNNDYIMQAECGKPVIYLYPTKDTLTTVKVGADISVSEPLYPTDGWTVLAHPSGQLDYQGMTYPNLFWEGKGHGLYPNLSDYGEVVSQDNLIPTLRKHLKLLGLNSQESTDFMEYWTEKLPTTPYVRLTWLGTKDMDRLAPLSVTPAPDTNIRIFLDFAGLEKPIKLIPQKLSSVPRVGFTLVEWGGLLVK